MNRIPVALAGAALFLLVSPAAADFDFPGDGGSGSGSSSSPPSQDGGSKKKGFRFSGKGYVLSATFCSAIKPIIFADHTGNTQQRQLTSSEVLGHVANCWVPGLGFVTRAVFPDTPATIEYARIAWLWAQLPHIKERIWMERGQIVWPSIQVMKRDLRQAGIRFGPKKKKRR